MIGASTTLNVTRVALKKVIIYPIIPPCCSPVVSRAQSQGGGSTMRKAAKCEYGRGLKIRGK